MTIFHAPLLFFTFLAANSCSLYESDARKFLRERGLEFSNQAQANLFELSEKHCSDHEDHLAKPNWLEVETADKYIIVYTNHFFKCTFEKTQPSYWQEQELEQLREIVQYRKQLKSCSSHGNCE